MTSEELKKLQITACKVRMGIIESTHAAACGHPGGSLSSADVLTYLYFKEMRVNPQEPNWADRDRFVLSKGHAAPALYAVLAERGYFPVSDLTTLRKVGSYLQGHPCRSVTPGIDMSTGSLGQGVSAAAGMALALKCQKKDSRVYTILGDGEIQEGEVWEALMFASHYHLDNLCVMIDNNNLQIDGWVNEVMSPYPIDEKLKAFGLEVEVIDGHDLNQIEAALGRARQTKGKPYGIVLKTVKGKGVSYMENVGSWHGKAPDDRQFEQAMQELKKSLEVLEK